MPKISNKLSALPPYLFAEIDKLKEKVKKEGKEIISLGIGDPDLPTPEVIIDALIEAVKDPVNHHYPSYEGLYLLRTKIVEWFKKRYNVSLNPESEVITLIGSKEGIGHFPVAYINPGDYVIVPDPAYPVYRSGTIFAEGIPFVLPLHEQNNFLPDLEEIPEEVRNKSKIFFLNYPNNPTSAMMTYEKLEEIVNFAHKYNIIIAYDAAYNEIYFDENNKPVSLMQIPGGKEIGIEFHSFSKTFNMTGWRIGFAVGNKEIITALGKVKNNLDSGVFQPIQYAAIKALENYDNISQKNRETYKERRDIFLTFLDKKNIKYFRPEATFYVWIKTPEGKNSKEIAMELLQNEGIVVTPGVGFGKFGEGYIRIALTVNKEILSKVTGKLSKIEW